MSEGPQHAALAELFAALNRHGAVVTAAYRGEVRQGADATEAALETLVRVNVLKPFEDGFMIHPRLRDFINEYLANFQAYRSLTRLSPLMAEARGLWDSMLAARREGAEEDALNNEREYRYKLGELAHSVDANVMLMQTLVTTRYGNVNSIGEKRRQNVFYQHQVQRLQDEFESLRVFCEQMEGRAITAERLDLQRAVYRELSARMPQWAAIIKEIALAVGAELFRQRQIEARLRRLANTAMLLVRQPMLKGFDVDPTDAGIPDCAWVVEATALRASPDIAHPSNAHQDALAAIARALPPAEVSLPPDASPAPPTPIADDTGRAPAVLEDVHGEAVIALADQLRRNPQHHVSLADYLSQRQELVGCGLQAWLVYAAVELPLHDIDVEFVDHDDRTAAEGPALNATFKDVLARAAA
jgi:hypothetical protein